MFYHDYPGCGMKEFFEHLLVSAYFYNILRFQLNTKHSLKLNFILSCLTGWSIHLSGGSSCNLHHNSSLAGEQKILTHPLSTPFIQA